jgi:hypothetical protein
MLNLKRNQLRIKTGLLKGHLIKLGLADSPTCDTCKQAPETASHVLCNKALAALRYRYLGCYIRKPCDFEDIHANMIQHFVLGAGQLNE